MKTYKISEHIFPNIIFNQDNILWSYLLSKSINSIHYKSAPNWAWIGKKPKAARNLILVYITGFFYFILRDGRENFLQGFFSPPRIPPLSFL